MATLKKLLREAGELQRRVWKAYEPIYVELGYSEFPPEHVMIAVIKGVEAAAAAIGDDRERIQLFRARKAIEEKRAIFVAEADECPFCAEPLGAPDAAGVRECPECLSRLDSSGIEVRP